MNYFISSYRADVTMIARAKADRHFRLLIRFRSGAGATPCSAFFISELGKLTNAGAGDKVMPAANKEQLLQLALSFADRTL
jgi:hypothetical protein